MNQIPSSPGKPIVLTGLCLALFLLVLPFILLKAGITTVPGSAKYLYLNELYYWCATGLIYLYTLIIEKQKFLIWVERSYPPGYYLKSVIKILLLLILFSFLIALLLKCTGVNTQSDKMNKIIQALNKSKFLVVFIPLTASVTEELICRGYLLARLELLINKPWISILMSSILFGALHASYGTLGQVLFPTCLGLIMAVHYYKYRNIKILIACHFIWDFSLLCLHSGG